VGEFEHDEDFAAAPLEGHLDLDRYEAVYQQLYTEALADGVITEDERSRLERAAQELGLDRTRLDALERALSSAYEAHHGRGVLDLTRMFGGRTVSTAPPDFVATVAPPPAPSGVPSEEVQQLYARVAFLEDRVRELERELEEARAQIAYEVDLSDVEPPVPSQALDAPEALHRRLRRDPRDVDTMKALYAAHAGDLDRQWCIAHALVYLGGAEAAHVELHEAHRPEGLVSPRAALDLASWRLLLHHPDDDAIISDIVGAVVPGLLLAWSAAMRQKGGLPQLDPARRLDPESSTVQAARCFGWAARTLGMQPPALCAAPDRDMVAQMVPTVPPTLMLGKTTLSGRSSAELAFLAGQQLAFFRRDRFVRLLVPDVVDMQDQFLAALLLGNKKLPLHADVRRRVEPIASAIEPLLEARELDLLRGAYQRFVEDGGVANLQRWAAGADLTAARAGFLLSSSLEVAERMLELEGVPQVPQAMEDLVVFATGDRYHKLRQQLGIAIERA
jgi:hypothetical protein